jgi:hypothetical protein
MVEYNDKLIGKVVDSLKSGTDPLTALERLTNDEVSVVKGTWEIGLGEFHPPQWDDAVNRSFMGAGDSSDIEHMAAHDLLKRLQKGRAIMTTTLFWYGFRVTRPLPKGQIVLCGPYPTLKLGNEERQNAKASDCEVSIVIGAPTADLAMIGISRLMN